MPYTHHSRITARRLALSTETWSRDMKSDYRPQISAINQCYDRSGAVKLGFVSQPPKLQLGLYRSEIAAHPLKLIEGKSTYSTTRR